MDVQLFTNDDLQDLFSQLDVIEELPEEKDPEMEASQRRYKEIIRKHKEA